MNENDREIAEPSLNSIVKKWPKFKIALFHSILTKNLPNKIIRYQKAINNTNNKEKMTLDRYFSLEISSQKKKGRKIMKKSKK